MADAEKPEDRWDGCYAICPWCEYQHGDCWEWAKEQPHAVRCSGCDNMFTVEAHYDVQYRAYVTGEEGP